MEECTQPKTRALRLLRLIAKAGRQEGFRLVDVVPSRTMSYVHALAYLHDTGLVERVVEGVCRWHYRVTPAGAAALKKGKLPSLNRVPKQVGPRRVGEIPEVFGVGRR